MKIIIMTSRSSLPETSWFTPNLIMMAREVTTPLEIMYEMPTEFKYIPINKSVWQLKETKKDALKYVRVNVHVNTALR